MGEDTMKSLIFLSIISLISFQGCSSKQVPVAQHTIKKPSTTLEKPSSVSTNDFEDEFQEESKTLIDPLSGYNRFMTPFNDIVITYALNPVSEVYGYVVPQPLRIGISNALKNLQFPVRFANNLLQGKFRNSAEEFSRFVFNSTLGLGGLIDVSTNELHILAHKEDFGQTLGYYGIGSGFHVVLPFLGPSNVRDIVGTSIDAYASPLVNVRGLEKYKIPNDFTQSTAIVAGHLINRNSLRLGQYESLKKDAIDLYPFLRDIYEQKRDAEIAE
jgi:phospholipid-binding lipoprotein MlaA